MHKGSSNVIDIALLDTENIRIAKARAPPLTACMERIASHEEMKTIIRVTVTKLELKRQFGAWNNYNVERMRQDEERKQNKYNQATTRRTYVTVFRFFPHVMSLDCHLDFPSWKKPHRLWKLQRVSRSINPAMHTTGLLNPKVIIVTIERYFHAALVETKKTDI